VAIRVKRDKWFNGSRGVGGTGRERNMANKKLGKYIIEYTCSGGGFIVVKARDRKHAREIWDELGMQDIAKDTDESQISCDCDVESIKKIRE
jgi:hypothetical protein